MNRILKIVGTAALGLALVSCTPGEGSRCNPLQFSNDCTDGLTCIYPTPNCGVAYCCAVNSAGKITDDNPNCQVIAACQDLSTPPQDSSMSD